LEPRKRVTDRALTDVYQRRDLADTELVAGHEEQADDPVSRLVGVLCQRLELGVAAGSEIVFQVPL